MEDDVEVVLNRNEPYKTGGKLSRLSLEEELVIDFERDDLAALGIADFLDVDSAGNLYCWCSHGQEGQIAKLNRFGKSEICFGRQGQGPGELQEPIHLWINDKNQSVISDYRRKICLFDKKGDLLKEMKLDPKFEMAVFLGNGNVLTRKPIRQPEEGTSEFPIILCNAKLEEIKMLQVGKRAPSLSLAKKIDPLEIYYYNYIWRISNGLIYVGNYRGDYELSIYDLDGGLVQKIRKEYNPIPVPGVLKKTILGRFEKHPMNDELKLTEKVYFSKYYPPYQYFFVDGENRLYVMTFEKGEGLKEFIYDIFDSDGVFIERTILDNCVYWPESNISTPGTVVAKNNRIYSVREKESGYKELVVHKMKWEEKN
jgi:hypothetical protein